MPQEVKTITLAMPYKLGGVNCYLIETEAGFILVDTGGSNKRGELEKELESVGCQPGNLNLIVLTHGDFDHSGNAAYLRKKFGAKIAMHFADLGMVERGDMSWNRTQGKFFLKRLAVALFGFGQSERFKPDFTIDEGTDLSEYGLDGEVLSIPGHSKGSIGILLKDSGDLICGDLFENTKKPSLNSIMDDLEAANASAEKLTNYPINTVYPGHGEPFPMDLWRQDQDIHNQGES